MQTILVCFIIILFLLTIITSLGGSITYTNETYEEVAAASPPSMNEMPVLNTEEEKEVPQQTETVPQDVPEPYENSEYPFTSTLI